MTPDVRQDEASALRHSLQRTTRSAGVLLLLYVALCGFLVFHAVTNDSARQHLLGQSEHARAHVVAAETDGRCRRGTRFSYRLEWTEGGEQRSEVVSRCRDKYDEGDTIDIWSTDDMPYTESPNKWRLLIGGLLVGFTMVAVYIGRQGDRTHRTFKAVLSGQPMAARFATRGDPLKGSLTVFLDPFDRSVVHEIPKGKHIILTPGRARRSVRTPTGHLTASELRDGKPWGLGLYEGDDGTRMWRSLT